MAIIWESTVPRGAATGFDHYQVRSAGNTLRLYTNGVFHSQFNPRHPVQGSVWDLLLLPAFFHLPETLNRVLVLGVGGGAVLRQLQYFLQPQLLVGVELNPMHLHIAEHCFGLRGEELTLLECDARDWLYSYDGPPFDLVIEDLFADSAGSPVRAVVADPDWCQRLAGVVAEDGTLVMNFVSRREAMASAWFSRSALRRHWLHSYGFSTPLYENQVAALTRIDIGIDEWRSRLQGYRELDERRSTCRLNYRIRKLARSRPR